MKSSSSITVVTEGLKRPLVKFSAISLSALFKATGPVFILDGGPPSIKSISSSEKLLHRLVFIRGLIAPVVLAVKILVE